MAANDNARERMMKWNLFPVKIETSELKAAINVANTAILPQAPTIIVAIIAVAAIPAFAKSPSETKSSCSRESRP